MWCFPILSLKRECTIYNYIKAIDGRQAIREDGRINEMGPPCQPACSTAIVMNDGRARDSPLVNSLTLAGQVIPKNGADFM